MIRTRVYRNGTCAHEDIDPARISDFLEEDDTIVCMCVSQPSAQEFALIAEEFSLNPLAVEDALHERQRPKLDHYDDHVFISLYDVRLDHDSGELVTAELAVFASERYLITVRKSPNMSPDDVVKRWDDNADLAPGVPERSAVSAVPAAPAPDMRSVRLSEEQIQLIADALQHLKFPQKAPARPSIGDFEKLEELRQKLLDAI